MSVLKQCPFCGDSGQLRRVEVYVPRVSLYGVICVNPDCIANDIKADCGSAEEAIEAWNRRTENDE